jgi:hypothetical protein
MDKITKEQTTKEQTECNELKTIKYKTLLMNGVMWPESKSSSNLENLDKYLETEKNNNANEPWSKLDKTAKIKKLTVFAENYKSEHNLSDEEYSKLIAFLKDCLDRKKLQRVKDVAYDKSNGEVKSVPALFHNKQTNHFTLKNTDKRVSTTRSLAPKKVRGTAKNVVTTMNDSDSDSEKE